MGLQAHVRKVSKNVRKVWVGLEGDVWKVTQMSEKLPKSQKIERISMVMLEILSKKSEIEWILRVMSEKLPQMTEK